MLCSIFRRTKNIFVSCIIGSHRPQSQHITAQALQKFSVCDFVTSTEAFIAKVGIACEHWCPYIERHRTPLCILYGNQALHTTLPCTNLSFKAFRKCMLCATNLFLLIRELSVHRVTGSFVKRQLLKLADTFR